MSDYHQELRFGGNVDPTANDPDWPLRLSRAIEQAGLDLIGIQDHPYNAGFLDTWTLIATLLQATGRVHIFPNVANLPLRPPAMLAKAAATLDVLSGGRVELGLGAGAFQAGIEAMGGPGRSKGESIAALEEAMQILQAFWSGSPTVRFAGKHYTVKGARPGPRPAHPIGLWLGVYGPRGLGITGRLADGWLPSSSYAPPERLLEMQQRITDAALAAGRQPQAIRRLYNVMGLITDGPMQDFLTGPVDYWQGLKMIAESERLPKLLGWNHHISSQPQGASCHVFYSTAPAAASADSFSPPAPVQRRGPPQFARSPGRRP